MAKLTRMIRDIIEQGFAREKVSQTTSDLFAAFRDTLLPTLEPVEFADMFAQTLAYGLFAARVNHTGPEPFDRFRASREIPRTNPFLRDLFETITGNALDAEPFVGFVDDLARLLAAADMSAVLEDFGRRTASEDPVVHFYETFLAAYDPKLRETRGVYYTPEPVVSYIVRSVDWVLKEHFGLSDGLADRSTVEYEAELPGGGTETRTSPRVLILDPACGTGTFLYHVIDHIRQKFVESNNAGMWPGFVAEHLLPRLFGFELLMAPYAVAHLKLGMQLAAQDMTEAQREKWAYDFEADQRLNVFLTNTLEEAEQTAQMQFGFMRAIAEEANAASVVKRDMPIMVIMGNPPYSGHSSNKGEWIQGLLRGKLPDGTETENYYEVDGEPLGERNPKWLQDDYVKFIRWAQWRIEQTGAGVLAFITNHAYLDNPTFRGMRESLLESFSYIHLMDLHGNTIKREVAPDGSLDENVFDIRPGVAIAVCVRVPDASTPATVHHSELWGTRSAKYECLRSARLATVAEHVIDPSPTEYLFTPRDKTTAAEFDVFTPIAHTMPICTIAVATHRDEFAVDYTQDALVSRLRDFINPEWSDDAVRERYFGVARRSNYLAGDNRDWRMADARRGLREEGKLTAGLQSYTYRPFDRRYVYYSSTVIEYPRYSVMHNMLRPNLAIFIGRAGHATGSGSWDIVHCSNHLVDLNCFRRGGSQVFPTYVYPDPGALAAGEDDLSDSPWPAGENGRRPNLSKEFVDEFADKLALEFVSDGRGDLKKTFGPEDIFDYIYAVFHCPTYRERYAEFLKIDFPRVPLTSDADLFRDLVGLGGRLVALHLMESEDLEDGLPSYPVPGDNLVEPSHPKYFAPGETAPGEADPLTQGRVYINRTKKKPDAPAQYFEGIEPEVWEFQVGGYQVLGKWLKDRKGRELSPEDLEHYRWVVVALRTTIEIMAAIDARIEDWPIT
jgi:predicted helicase